MRTQLLGLAGISMLCLMGADCCGVGEPFLSARYSVYEGCDLYSCPVAVGSEVQVFVVDYDLVNEGRIRSAKLAESGLAELELFHNDVLLRPYAVGETEIEATLVDGSKMPSLVRFAERASTHTVSSLRTNPPDRPLVFAGSVFGVSADHRDDKDRPLLGHGLEAWSISGGKLGEVADDGYRDTFRVRQVIVGDDRHVIVRARPDATPYEADVVQPGSTVSLELLFDLTRLYNTGIVGLFSGRRLTVPVNPYAADRRFINGMPRDGRLTATTDNFDVATAQVISGTSTLDVLAAGPGSTVLTVTFDGITRRFRIDVQ